MSHDSSPRTVLILGANGRLGLAAAQAFDRAGWRVLAQTRRPLAAGMPATAQRIDASVGDLDGLVRRAGHVDVVVHALNPLYTRWNEEALPLARAGMDVAERLGARFMLPGNVYNFGEGMPALLKDDTPERPTNDKGRLRCELEAEMAARAPRPGRPGGLRSVVIRAGDFYGGNGTWIDLLIAKSLKSGKLVYPGPTNLPHAWAYLPDLAQSFVAVAERPQLPDVLRVNFPGHALTGAALLDAIEVAARELGLIPPGQPVKRGGFPWIVLRALGWAVPMWRELAKMSYLWRVPHALDGSGLAAVLGGADAVPETPLNEAMRATLKAIFTAPQSAAASPPPPASPPAIARSAL